MSIPRIDAPARSPAPQSRIPGGLGLGWRPPLADYVRTRGDLAFLEVVAESVCGPGPLPRALCEAGLPVLVHGVSLGLGGTDDLDPSRVQSLVDTAVRLDAPLVSEHIAFVRAGDLAAGHLLPVPRTAEALAVLVRHVRELQAELPVPLALEHIAALVSWPENTMTEAAFVAELLERTGASLVLDLANLAADAHNFGADPVAFLDHIPLERVAYCHVAGGIERDGLWHDTHAHPVAERALELVSELRRRCPTMPGVLLERDDRWPRATELDADLDRIARRSTVTVL